MAKPSRIARARPNPAVSIDDYYDVLTQCLSKNTSLEAKFGNRFAGDLRQVTPHSLHCLADIVSALIEKGVADACANCTSLERAFTMFIGNFAQPKSRHSGQALGTKSCSHTMAHLSLLRAYIAEDQVGREAVSRRYPKSGGLRRSLLSDDYNWFQTLLSEVQKSCVSEERTEQGQRTQHAEQSTEQARQTNNDADMSDISEGENGIPLIFARIIADDDSGKNYGKKLRS